MKYEKTTGNRHGKHDDDLVSFGGFVTPELKALARVAADELGMTMMDMIRDGVYSSATRVGVIKNGEIVEAYKPIVKAYAAAFRAKKEQKRKTKLKIEGS